MLSLAPEDTVQFADLSVTEDQPGSFVVGSAESGEFVSIPSPGVFLIRQLQDGRSVAEVTSSFRSQFGEDPGLADFLADLGALGFVERVGSTKQVRTTPERSRGIVLLGRLGYRHCRWLMSPIITALVVVAWTTLPILLVTVHFPQAEDALVFPSVLVLLVVFVPVAWILLALHELAHSLVARAQGCPAYTRFGNRLWNLVCETDLSSIYSLPRKRRLRALLAGISFDVIVLDICLLLQAAHVGVEVSLVVAYMLFSNLAYQACIFMRTDLYYAISTVIGINNLVPRARAECAYLLRMVLRRPGPRPPATRMERVAIAGYLIGCVVGIGLGAITVVQLIIPATVGVISLAGQAIGRGPADPEFWAALFVIAFFIFVYSVLSWTFIRNRRDVNRNRPQPKHRRALSIGRHRVVDAAGKTRADERGQPDIAHDVTTTGQLPIRPPSPTHY